MEKLHRRILGWTRRPYAAPERAVQRPRRAARRAGALPLWPSLVAALLAPQGAAAAPGEIAVELNDAVPQDGACRLVFTARNGLAGDIDRLVYEAVVFDAEGAVRLITLLDFLDLPQGRLPGRGPAALQRRAGLRGVGGGTRPLRRGDAPDQPHRHRGRAVNAAGTAR